MEIRLPIDADDAWALAEWAAEEMGAAQGTGQFQLTVRVEEQGQSLRMGVAVRADGKGDSVVVLTDLDHPGDGPVLAAAASRFEDLMVSDEYADPDVVAVAAAPSNTSDQASASRKRKFGKTAEEKEREAEARAAAAYAASPLGRADRAMEMGAAFFQVEIPHSSLWGYANLAWSAGTSTQRKLQHGGAPDLLGQIESLGWTLQHASWVYVQTGQNSRDKFLATGQETVVTGEVVGIYLFRRAGT